MKEEETMAEPTRGSRVGVRLGIGVMMLIAALALAACGGGGSSSTATTTESGGAEETVSAEEAGGSEGNLTAEAKEVVEKATQELMYSTVEVPNEPSQVVPYGKWRGPESAPAHEAGKNIQVIVCTKTSPACMEAAEGITEAAKVIGWKAEVIDGEGTPQGFAAAFNTAFSRNPDAIITLAVPSATVGKSLSEAKEKGILTVIAGDKEPESGPRYDAYVPFPMPAMTAVLGWSMINETEGNANVIAINDPGYPVLIQSLESLEGVLSACEGCSVSKVNQQITEAVNPSKVNANITGALANDPEANYIYTPYSLPLAALIQTVQSAGKSDSVKIVAKDGDGAELKAVGEGTLAMSVGSSTKWAGWASIDQVMRGLAGEKYLGPTETGLGIAAFDKENVPASGSIEDWPAMIPYAKEYERIWGS